VIQFGEGNFMRAFVDWQLHQMNKQNLFNGSAILIQPIERGLADMLAEQDQLYTILLKGIENGDTVNSHEIITSVSRCLNPYTDYDAFLALAEQDELEFITSNTTEAGITYEPADQLSDSPPRSFPAKLTALLHARYKLGKAGFTIIPCELIDRNGEKLKEIVLKYTEVWQLGEGFVTWLEQENTFCCSLVDRIVPGYPRDTAAEVEAQLGYHDKLMVMAEPFLFWVIEGPSSLKTRLPLAEAGLNVVVTDDMTPYRERKVHLLNGPHTAMVPLALLAGLQTVEDVMRDDTFSLFVQKLIEEELIPMLDLPQEQLQAYAKAVQERFCNPFVRHELSSISLNSISKFKTRLLPILLRYEATKKQLPSLLTLAFAALLLSYRGDVISRQDADGVIAIFDEAWSNPSPIEALLSNSALWGTDLTTLPNLVTSVESHITNLVQLGSRKVLQQQLQVEV
jgi:tagaturonate reductase